MAFPNLYGTEPYSMIKQNLVLGNLHGMDKLRECNPPEELHRCDKITLAINCTPDRLMHIDGVKLINVGWEDGYPMPALEFAVAMDAAKAALANGETIMVACHAGISRSPSLMAAIMVANGISTTYDAAIENIKFRRRWVEPNVTVMTSMKEHLNIFPYNMGWEKK